MIAPFVEAVSRNEAAPALHGIAKRRLIVNRFPAPVDQEAESARILDPGWYQPPSQQGELASSLGEPHDRDGLRRRDIVTGGKIGLLRILEELPDRVRGGNDQIASAHAKLHSVQPTFRRPESPVTEPYL
jgi:hypothetical protein